MPWWAKLHWSARKEDWSGEKADKTKFCVNFVDWGVPGSRNVYKTNWFTADIPKNHACSKLYLPARSLHCWTNTSRLQNASLCKLKQTRCKFIVLICANLELQTSWAEQHKHAQRTCKQSFMQTCPSIKMCASLFGFVFLWCTETVWGTNEKCVKVRQRRVDGTLTKAAGGAADEGN